MVYNCQLLLYAHIIDQLQRINLLSPFSMLLRKGNHFLRSASEYSKENYYFRKKPANVGLLPTYKSVNHWTKHMKKRENPYVMSWKDLSFTVEEEPKQGTVWSTVLILLWSLC